MKKLVQFLAVSLVSILLLNSCQSTPEQKTIAVEGKVKKTEVLAENKTEVEMEVEGMVCAMGCAKFIEDKVAGLDGIVASNVNFEEGKASFEFDKTAISPTEIETFINEIHDGQYKAKIASSELQNVEEVENSDSEKKSLGSVTEKINISFPELFTYFIKRVI